jgi:hypothetical protein
MASITLGMAAAGPGMFGAYEFGRKLEGGVVSYLTLAAPLIALAAALSPPFAERTWRQGHYGKSLIWWLVLIPAAATVFFTAVQRVHVAKAGAEAERSALRKAAHRAAQELSQAKQDAAKAQAESRRAEARKTCGVTCREAKQARDEAHARLEKAEQALFTAEAKATTEANLKAPEWLLPAALDLVAFMATGLTGPKVSPIASKPKARTKRKVKVRAKAVLKPVRPTDLDHLRLVK